MNENETPEQAENAEPLQESEEIVEEKPAPSPKEVWSPALASARRGLLFLAWIIALVVGWNAVSTPLADLLEATVRGAIAWLGTWLLGNLGIGLIERIIAPPEQTDINQTA